MPPDDRSQTSRSSNTPRQFTAGEPLTAEELAELDADVRSDLALQAALRAAGEINNLRGRLEREPDCDLKKLRRYLRRTLKALRGVDWTEQFAESDPDVGRPFSTLLVAPRTSLYYLSQVVVPVELKPLVAEVAEVVGPGRLHAMTGFAGICDPRVKS
jgi:hypothetical protein